MSGKKVKPKRYERGYHPPSYYVWQEKHPRVVIYLTPEIKTQIGEIVEREKREQSKKTSLSKWCSEIVMSAFDESCRREILSDAIIHELTKEARVTADTYYKEKKHKADELYRKSVEYHNDLFDNGFREGRQEGLKRGEALGRANAEREFEGRLREADEGKEDTEEAIKEARAAGRREEHEKDKKQYNTLLDERVEEYKRLLKNQKDIFNAMLEKAKEECREKGV